MPTVKAIEKLTVLCLAICALAVTATAQTTWKLSRDLLATNNQISFNQGANGVWYFLRSSSLAHLPKTYQFLSAYFEPCVSDSFSTFADGMSCWQNPDLERGIYRIPLVGINSTFTSQSPNGVFGIPPRSVFMHPSSSGLAIIGWKSPITGLVDVTGFFSDLDPTGATGVIWSVDKGGQRLTSGTIDNGGPPQTFTLVRVSVSAGQVLYFTVNPNRDDTSDTTGVDVKITTSE
jgi:hypothetical protein